MEIAPYDLGASFMLFIGGISGIISSVFAPRIISSLPRKYNWNAFGPSPLMKPRKHSAYFRILMFIIGLIFTLPFLINLLVRSN